MFGARAMPAGYVRRSAPARRVVFVRGREPGYRIVGARRLRSHFVKPATGPTGAWRRHHGPRGGPMESQDISRGFSRGIARPCETRGRMTSKGGSAGYEKEQASKRILFFHDRQPRQDGAGLVAAERRHIRDREPRRDRHGGPGRAPAGPGDNRISRQADCKGRQASGDEGRARNAFTRSR